MALLTDAECNDLRARVLRGEELSVEDAKRVIEKIRGGQALIPMDKPKRTSGGKKAAMSTEALNDSLKGLGL